MNHGLILKTKISEVPKKPCPEILKPKQSRNALGRQDGGDRSERGLRSTCCHCPAGVSRMMDRLNPWNLPLSQPQDGPGYGQRCRPEMRKGSLSGLNFLKGPHGPRHHRRSCCCLWSRYFEAWDSYGHMQPVHCPMPLWCPQVLLPQRAMLMWVASVTTWDQLRFAVCVATEGHESVSALDTAKGLVDICGPCYHRDICMGRADT